MALPANHRMVAFLRKQWDDLQTSPTGGTVQNIVSEFEDRGGFEGRDRVLYQAMLDNPNDKDAERAMVTRMRELLRELLAATGNPVGGRRRTKKRKSLTKRNTRKR